MAKSSNSGSNIGGRGSRTGAKVVGGGNGKRQSLGPRGTGAARGRHPGVKRGTKRVGG